MIDYRPELVSALRTLGLPVEYELFLTSDTEIPCISYRLTNDRASAEGDTIGYSELTFAIKVWSTKLADLAYYSNRLDILMRNLGFKRGYANELWLNGIGQIEIRYTGLGIENFNEGDML